MRNGEQNQMSETQTTPTNQGAQAPEPAGSAVPSAPGPAAPAADAGPDAWIQALPAEVQQQIQAHTGKLAGALRAERDARKELERKAAELASQAAAGSDAQLQLQQVQAQLAATERRAAFAEQAAGRITDPALAWMAAERAGLVDATSGQVDLARLQMLHPALFQQAPTAPPVAPTNGAAGSRGSRALTREDVARMTPAEINGRWDEVQQVLQRP